MSWAAVFAGAYTYTAAAFITLGVFDMCPPTVAWPIAVLATAAAGAAMRVVRLEAAGRYRP